MYVNWVLSFLYVVEDCLSGELCGLILEFFVYMFQVLCGMCYSYKVWNISFVIDIIEKIIELDS